MTSSRNFQNMINDYVDMDLIYDEGIKQDWLMSQIEHRKDWQGGNGTASPAGTQGFIIPMAVSTANAVQFGGIVPLANITQTKTIRPIVPGYKEVGAALIFNETDLVQNDKVNEQNFIKLLPNEVERASQGFKNALSLNILIGRSVSSTLSGWVGDNAVTGKIAVAYPERFEINMPVVVQDNNTGASAVVFVAAIDMNVVFDGTNNSTANLTVVTTAGGSTFPDLSGYTAAQAAVVRRPGQDSAANALTSIPDILLPASAGGTAGFYNTSTGTPIAKTSAPILQGIYASGASITTTNILDKIFAHYVLTRKRGKGKPFNVLMSYTNYGACLQRLEAQKGQYNVIPNSQKTSLYGFDEIMIGGFAGTIKLVALNEMNDDTILFLDLSSMLIASNGGIRKRVDLNGNSYYVIRNDSTGYQYVMDNMFYGEFVLHTPNKNGILFGIPTLTLG